MSSAAPITRLVLGLTLAASLLGQAAEGVPASGPAGDRQAPMPPQLKSPVDAFRVLLAMTPLERRQSLTNRSEPSQKAILAKLREYESMRPEDRELRLRVTELRWHLLPLMQMNVANRAEYLARLSPQDQELIGDRLTVWDRLPAEVQRELLENEATLRYFSEVQAGNAEQQKKLMEGMSPARREKLQAGVTQWRALNPSQRVRITANFSRFFELSGEEKTRALSNLSDEERRQIERTLKAYDRLPPAQRAECLRSFEKFTSLSIEERQQFLKNAERWKLMSLSERESWRQLVARMSSLPPMPRDSRTLPPIPRGLDRRVPSPPVATTNR